MTDYQIIALTLSAVLVGAGIGLLLTVLAEAVGRYLHNRRLKSARRAFTDMSLDRRGLK